MADNGEANEAKANEADVANKLADATEVNWAGNADAANKASVAGKAN